ncbi:MAG: hypothetical protein JNM07_14590 [Phycisphaerae bacterium]|nr:hypothetical protein [Phycisphaerae bacterium]
MTELEAVNLILAAKGFGTCAALQGPVEHDLSDAGNVRRALIGQRQLVKAGIPFDVRVANVPAFFDGIRHLVAVLAASLEQGDAP